MTSSLGDTFTLNAISALSALRATDAALTTSLGRISSGRRITTARDDAATWAASTMLSSELSTLSAYLGDIGSADSALSVGQRAAAAAVGVIDQLRATVTAAQAPGADLNALQADVTTLQGQLKATVAGGGYGGLNILDGGQNTLIPVGNGVAGAGTLFLGIPHAGLSFDAPGSLAYAAAFSLLDGSIGADNLPGAAPAPTPTGTPGAPTLNVTLLGSPGTGEPAGAASVTYAVDTPANGRSSIYTVSYTDDAGTARTLSVPVTVSGNGDANDIAAQLNADPGFSALFHASGHAPAGMSLWHGYSTTATPKAVATDASGNTYTLEAVQADSNTAHIDTVIIKSDNLGNVLWTYELGNSNCVPGSGLILDSSGNVVFETDASGAQTASIIGALNPNTGALIWSHAFTYLQKVNSIAQDAAGNYYLLGQGLHFHSADMGYNYGDTQLIKLNAAGTQYWAQDFGVAYPDVAGQVSLDSAGNLLTANWYGNPAFPTKLHPDLESFDQNGNLLWHESSSAVIGYVTGVADGADHLDVVGTLTTGTAGSSDLYLAQFDEAGNVLWQKDIGSAYADGGTPHLAVDASHNIYVTGDLGTGSGSTDAYLGIFASNGASISQRSIGLRGAGASNMHGDNISIDPSGKIDIITAVDSGHAYTTILPADPGFTAPSASGLAVVAAAPSITAASATYSSTSYANPWGGNYAVTYPETSVSGAAYAPSTPLVLTTSTTGTYALGPNAISLSAARSPTGPSQFQVTGFSSTAGGTYGQMGDDLRLDFTRAMAAGQMLKIQYQVSQAGTGAAQMHTLVLQVGIGANGALISDDPATYTRTINLDASLVTGSATPDGVATAVAAAIVTGTQDFAGAPAGYTGSAQGMLGVSAFGPTVDLSGSAGAGSPLNALVYDPGGVTPPAAAGPVPPDYALVMSQLAAAESTITHAGAMLGDSQQRLALETSFLDRLRTITTTGQDNLVGTDYSSEAARLDALTAQKSLAVSMLAIANAAPRRLLSLFEVRLASSPTSS